MKQLSHQKITAARQPAPAQPLGFWGRASSAVATCLARGRLLICAATLALVACSAPAHWQLNDVQGHLPDLNFSLVADNGAPVTAANYQGKTILAFFGYTHCPDVCPETMARLTQVIAALGTDARDVRILFISVDPARDNPTTMHAYVDAFDPHHAIGLSGTPAQVRELARAYRVAYQAEPPGADGNYDVTHSSAVYVFDRHGAARLLITATDPFSSIVADLRQLIHSA